MPNRRRVGVPWRRDPEVLARLARVEPLRLRRVPNTQIAAQEHVDEATIRRDCERLDQLWQERIQVDAATLRGQIATELDYAGQLALEAAAWDAMCERAVLFDDLADAPAESGDTRPVRRSVYRDHKGAAQFRGQKAQALNVYRQTRMDKAKVLGLVVDPDEGSASEVLVRVVVREAH